MRLVRNTRHLNLNNLNRHAGFRGLCQPRQAYFTWKNQSLVVSTVHGNHLYRLKLRVQLRSLRPMQTNKENEKTQKKILNTPITKISGILMFIGAVQWFLVILLAEGLHPGYNSAIHYASSLGVGKTAIFYNTSVILLGLTTIVGTYLMQGSHSSRAFTLLLVITGLATIGVGIFPENVRPLHGIVTPIAFICGG